MTQPALVQLPGVTEATTQWRAEKLQLVNWGGFHGYAYMPIAHDATLLSGASGTGKSTLLDAYLALMMPSDTPFNGASNDATAGRARGADQRNLLSYLRGKLDTNREAGTGELTDQVLRGLDSPTWGAIAMNFIDDRQRRFTVLRAYFVPRGATRTADITMKMATIEAAFDLRHLEPLARVRFDKRAMTTRWPEMRVHDTYAAFSQTLFTRLGIGAGGDGVKALRLLARIQAGHQIRTVDGLYKSMVLEEPATYPAADRAAAHFADLDASYQAMLTEAEKLKVLNQLPGLYRDLDEARSTEQMIDTFGISRDGDSPFLLWQLVTERRLLRHAVDANRQQRRDAADDLNTAVEHERGVRRDLDEVVTQQKANGGDILASLKIKLEELETAKEQTQNRRARFDERTAVLAAVPGNEHEFVSLQAEARTFLAGFEARTDDLDGQLRQVQKAAYPLTVRREELIADHESLKSRHGLVPRRLHEARIAVAHSCGIDVTDLPFVAELIDVAPGEEAWRRAAEVTLFSLARVMLVDARRLEYLSRTIDPVRLPFRIRFEGVELSPFLASPADPQYISGKLVHKDSPFSSWVQQRIRRRGADALCVDDPAHLRGDGARVTRNGQTRDGASGAHGELSEAPIIGFSNTERLRQIEAELHDIDTELGDLGRREADLRRQLQQMDQQRTAHQYVADCDWPSIDVAAVHKEITSCERERERILAASNVLAALQVEYNRLQRQLDDASRAKYGAERRRDELDSAHSDLAKRQDNVDQDLDRIEQNRTASLTPAQIGYLDAVFTSVGDSDSLPGFKDNVRRLRSRLVDASQNARRDAQKATESMCRIFEAFQARWPDPNLGTGVESYIGYRDILDTIVSTGLHERRQEWRRRLSEWSGQDLVPLNGAFDTAIEDIEDRLAPVNAILAALPFGPGRDRLRISLRRLSLEDITKFRRELKELSSGVTQDVPDDQIERRFTRLREFIKIIRAPEPGTKTGGTSRDTYLDVRKHVDITAVRTNAAGVDVASYASLGGKSGGEAQELVAFIVGAALRFQLGDEDRVRPRFAPVFLDEGFVKSDSEFAGRAVNAWKGLGFQLVIGAPLDKVTALEPDMQLLLTITKSAKGYSHITELRSADPQP